MISLSDELLYPKVIERLPEQTSSTEAIKHEHEDIQALLSAVPDACKGLASGRRRSSGKRCREPLTESHRGSYP
jgi:hypothetical protein